MKYITLLIGAFLLMAPARANTNSIEPSLDPTMKTAPVSSVMTQVEEKVRSAAVKVVRSGSRSGHGSGALVNYKGLTLVFTAQHVADGILGGTYYAIKSHEVKPAILIYSDELHDIAILYLVEPFNYVKPLKFSPRKGILEVGEEITYSAFPADHRLLTFRGRVAGYEILSDAGLQILLNTQGWFGCSGSLVYDVNGDIVGVLWGIDVQAARSLNIDQVVLDNLIWVSPIQNINMELALSSLCESLNNKHRACR